MSILFTLKYFLGIDPGRQGGLALIDENKNLLYVEPISLLGKGNDYHKICDMIDHLPEMTMILLELKPGVMEKSASPTTRFGFHCGALFGICIRHNLEIISPKKWKTEFDLTREYKESRDNMKLRSVILAEKIFNRTIKSNEDGLAEALLVAEYGRRHLERKL
jgi:hypothetical protein